MSSRMKKTSTDNNRKPIPDFEETKLKKSKTESHKVKKQASNEDLISVTAKYERNIEAKNQGELNTRDDFTYTLSNTQKRLSHHGDFLPKKNICGGTVKALVENLGLKDAYFSHTFFATYRAFSTPKEISTLLKKRFNVPSEEVSILSWLSEVSSTSYTSKSSAYTYLKSGVVLCKVLNHIKPGLVPEINKKSSDFAQTENIQNFLQGAQSLGVQSLFDVSVLNTGIDMGAVFKCLKELIDIVWESGLFDVPFIKKNPKVDVLDVLYLWLSKYSYDFDDALGKSVNKDISKFIKSLADDEALAASPAYNQVANLFKKKKKTHKVSRMNLSTYAKNSAQSLQVEKFTAHEFAQQLLILEADLLISLPPYEILSCKWTKESKYEKAPAIMAMIDQFNHMSSFVSTRVLECESLEGRAAELTRFIAIAEECISAGNFSSAKAIVSSLQGQPLFRMKKTWALLSKTIIHTFDSLSTLLDENENYSALRNDLQSRAPPCIPYLGVFLTDMTMLDAALDDYVNKEKKIINFEKRRKEYALIQTLGVYQFSAKKFIDSISPHYSFYYWFITYPTLDYEKCYELSVEREAKPPKKLLESDVVKEKILKSKEKEKEKEKEVQENIKIFLPSGSVKKVTVNSLLTTEDVIKQVVDETRQLKTREYQNQEFKLILESAFGDFVIPTDKLLLAFCDNILITQLSTNLETNAEGDIQDSVYEDKFTRKYKELGLSFFLVQATNIVKVSVVDLEYRSFVVDFEATALSVALESLSRSNIQPEHCHYSLVYYLPNGEMQLLPDNLIAKYLSAGNSFRILDLSQETTVAVPVAPVPIPAKVTNDNPSKITDKKKRMSKGLPSEPAEKSYHKRGNSLTLGKRISSLRLKMKNKDKSDFLKYHSEEGLNTAGLDNSLSSKSSTEFNFFSPTSDDDSLRVRKSFSNSTLNDMHTFSNGSPRSSESSPKPSSRRVISGPTHSRSERPASFCAILSPQFSPHESPNESPTNSPTTPRSTLLTNKNSASANQSPLSTPIGSPIGSPRASPKVNRLSMNRHKNNARIPGILKPPNT